MLSDRALLLVHDIACRIMRDSSKPKNMQQQAWVAKCWEQALLEMYKKEGKGVCSVKSQ